MATRRSSPPGSADELEVNENLVDLVADELRSVRRSSSERGHPVLLGDPPLSLCAAGDPAGPEPPESSVCWLVWVEAWCAVRATRR